MIPCLNFEAKQARLESQLQALLAFAEDITSGSPDGSQPAHDAAPPDANNAEDMWEDINETNASGSIVPPVMEPKLRMDPVPKKKHLTPDQAALNLYAKWRALLPTLVDPYLAYSAGTTGKKLRPLEGASFDGKRCVAGAPCERKETSVLCLFWDQFARL
ncbi:hypothetical protein CVT26_009398 [Gymnopilus dilepis]|uniref:Uncharacterized protein n=1 Tax=Gymnopilus dilepis TaxID=231916 RepID=A0A409YIE8_9AGAR|nr:hypothetical protein CVT26_009398 [Gymnopilus dilepis]